MKTLKLLVIGMFFLIATIANGQVSVTLNLGSPPQWGPTGYSNIRYYYLPDIESYYDIQLAKFIYFNGVTWVHRTYLPAKHRNYDLYRGYKVVMTDYRGDKPYTNFREYKTKYIKGYKGQAQRNIGENQDRRDFNSNTVNTNNSHKNKQNGGGRYNGSKHNSTRKDHPGEKGKRK